MTNEEPAVHVDNPGGAGAYVLCADHATSAVPAGLGGLGLPEAVLAGHIAWDPGALDVARDLARRLDAALVHPGASAAKLALFRFDHEVATA